MPYITEGQRKELDKGRVVITPGELNYQVSKLATEYLKAKGEERYFVYNEIIGALECAKFELYRRMIAPYEDKSIKKNGDVYHVEQEEEKPPREGVEL